MLHNPQIGPANVWPPQHLLQPGTSLLGGAAAGLSYEGAFRDALARDERKQPRPPRHPPTKD